MKLTTINLSAKGNSREQIKQRAWIMLRHLDSLSLYPSKYGGQYWTLYMDHTKYLLCGPKFNELLARAIKVRQEKLTALKQTAEYADALSVSQLT